MMQMQTLASDILLMERGQSKTVTGKEHLERNDFIIEKQKAELQRIEAVKRHKEQQVNLAEQELRQVKSCRTGTPSGEIGDTHGQAQRRSHRCCYGYSKRSGFSFRQWKNEETGTIQRRTASGNCQTG